MESDETMLNSCNLPEEEMRLLASIEAAYQAQRYPVASELIHNRLGSSVIDVSNRSGASLLLQLAGLLVDIAKGNNLRTDAELGLSILERNQEDFYRITTPASLAYNIGNAKHSIFTIDKIRDDYEHTPDSIRLLIEAKNSYLKALKILTPYDSRLEPMLLVNLGTVFSESGRISEAIHCYDLALEKAPGFQKALGCRSTDLIWLNTLTEKYSKMMLVHVYHGLVVSLADSSMPPLYRRDQEEKLRQTISALNKHGVNDIDQVVEEYLSADRRTALSEFQKYSLKHGLFLSESGIYCYCPEGCSDSLDFDESGLSTSLAKRMRLVLERTKSEYAYARWLYWESIHWSGVPSGEYWPLSGKSEILTELTGPKSEMLRNSYRSAYAILDKIGSALFDLFEMPSPLKRVYYDTLWKLPKKQQTDSATYRWPELKSMERFPLIGLFSLATELDHASGEWSHFKEWRNALEHRGLYIADTSNSEIENHELKKYFQIVTEKDMQEQCLRLLQVTAGALINFSLCVKHASKWRLKNREHEINL